MNEFVDVQITLGTSQISRAGFGTALIFSKTALFNDVRSYSDITEVAEDFSSSSETYLLASRLFSQDLKPESIKIAKDPGVDIEDDLNDLIEKDNDWYFLIIESFVKADILDAAAWTETNKKLFAFQTRDADVETAAIDDVMSALKASGYDRSIGFFSPQPQPQIQTLTFDADLVTANVVNGKIGTDAITPITFATDHETTMNALTAEILSNENVETAVLSATPFRVITITFKANRSIDLTGWLVTLGASQATITPAETQANITGTANNRIHASAVGKMAPRTPGSATWKFKQLVGEIADVFTSTQQAYIQGKNCNIYKTVAGASVIQEGIVASGEFIDVIRGTDLLVARIEEEVYSAFVNTEKIPFTDDGVSVVTSATQGVLVGVGIANGILAEDPAPAVTAPKVSEVSIANKGARLLPDVKFTGTLAGAIHKTIIRGTISV